MANEYTAKYQVYVVIKGRIYKECGCLFEYDAKRAVECLIEGGEVEDAFYKAI